MNRPDTNRIKEGKPVYGAEKACGQRDGVDLRGEGPDGRIPDVRRARTDELSLSGRLRHDTDTRGLHIGMFGIRGQRLFRSADTQERLMEKLEIDISVVEREKERITELLEDYVREIHSNLGKIDHNSTITIRERNIKMLKIQLPDWEENAGLYRLRLEDFIDKITMEGVELFEKNENAQEFFGSGITTRNLYDQVVGIGNVQIHLYKIEAQREYPITWKEVSRNSGGEGFLSAFVILSSLLYYMRRDDTDIFADKNEGKVLIMDNPFAQTNASHLLIPLMDMAKKSISSTVIYFLAPASSTSITETLGGCPSASSSHP